MKEAQRRMRVLSLVVLWCSFIAANSSFTLIGADGLCKTASAVERYLYSAIPSGKIDRIVHAIGCSGLESDNQVINNLLGCRFSDDVNQISLDADGSQLVSYSSFDHFLGDKMCGCKAVDFVACQSAPIVLVLRGTSDAEELDVAYGQILRRVLAPIASERNTVRKSLLILLRAPSGSQSVAEVKTWVENVWKDLDGIGAAEDSLQIQVAVIEEDNSSSVSAAKAGLDSFGENVTFPLSVENTVQQLTNTWSSLPEPQLLPSKAYLRGIGVVEAAYATLLHESDAVLATMRRRVESGRLVSGFASRVRNLLDSVSGEFEGLVRGQECVRERLERLKMLRDYVLQSGHRLLDKQVALLELRETESLRKTLHRAYAKGLQSAEEMERIVKDAVRAFAKEVAHLEDPSIDLVASAQLVADFEGKARKLVSEFPDSPEAKLLELKRLEKELARPSFKSKGKGKGRKRAFSWSLSLVGMLRPSGFGNAQGFVSYATSLLGVPVDLMLGMQNDGDAPEVVGEDREHPLLRVQPKFAFDIDL